MKKNNRGYILAYAMCATVVVMLLVASVFALVNTQRRLSLKKELMLQANNVAETALDYVYSCMINDISANSIRAASSVPSSGYIDFQLDSGVQTFLTGSPTMASGYSGKISPITYSNLSVRALPSTTTTRYFISSLDLANSPSPIKDNFVYEQLVPLVARVTATQGGQSYTAYVEKAVASQEVDLFQYAIFYQGQLHMHRGFRPMGDVHTNGVLFLNAQDGDTALYNGAVSATGYLYRGSTFDVGGTGSDGYGYVPVVYSTSATGTLVPAADFSSARSPKVVPSLKGLTNQLKILIGGTTNYAEYDNHDISINGLANWLKYTDRKKGTFIGNLLDAAQGVPNITPVGSAGYQQDSIADPTKLFINGPYQLLEPTFPVSSTYNNVRLTDNSNNLEARASLVLIVEYNITDTIHLHTIANGTDTAITAGKDASGNYPDLTLYSDPWRMFVLKGYKVKKDWNPRNNTLKDIHDYLDPITLPERVFGAADSQGTVAGDSANGLLPSFVPPANSLKMEDFDAKIVFSNTSGVPAAYRPVNHTINEPIASWVAARNQKTALDTKTDTIVQINSGLFDSRLGRGVSLLTVDIDALKDIMEAPVANFTSAAVPVALRSPTNAAFRSDFDPTAATGTHLKWNGLIYIEFPTSLSINSGSTINTKNSINSIKFAYESNPETRHPDRTSETVARSRGDKIVPIAKELRRYPAANEGNNSTILDAQYVIPAVQLINGRYLPHPNSGSSTEGFSIATNVPVYVVGNYNTSGNYSTSSNIANNTPGSYAQAETDTDLSKNEITAAIFSDMFTVLSNGWGLPYTGASPTYLSNRNNSFYGTNNGSTNGQNTVVGSIASPPGRPAKIAPQRVIPIHYKTLAYNTDTYAASNPTAGTGAGPYVIISACIATGEYPIFEFFTHALESFNPTAYPLYNNMSTTSANPIIFKGSLVGMFHSEIQHIKQAYGRSIANNVQTSGDPSGDIWQQHGSFAIAGSRYHQFLVNGNFPPGTPVSYFTTQKGFTLMHWNDTTPSAHGANPNVASNLKTDGQVLTAAGFSP
jgi:hypothetical protein